MMIMSAPRPVSTPPTEVRSKGISRRKAAGFELSENGPLIGIGGHLAVPPLPHHRAYGSRTRRFDWVKLNQEHEVEGDRVSRRSGSAEPVGPPGVRTCARAPSVNRRRPLHGTWVRHDGAVR